MQELLLRNVFETIEVGDGRLRLVDSKEEEGKGR